MLNRCRAFKVLPRVRIPASPPVSRGLFPDNRVARLGVGAPYETAPSAHPRPITVFVAQLGATIMRSTGCTDVEPKFSALLVLGVLFAFVTAKQPDEGPASPPPHVGLHLELASALTFGTRPKCSAAARCAARSENECANHQFTTSRWVVLPLPLIGAMRDQPAGE